MKRHRDALAIQNGACNPSGIAHSILEACQEIRKDGGDTAAITGDSAVRLMVHQLAYICGVHDGVSDLAKAPHYSESTKECEKELEKAASHQHPCGKAIDFSL